MISGRVNKIGAPHLVAASDSHSSASHAAIKVKSSMAFRIWLGVVVTVMFALWLQMRGAGNTGSYNFLIEGNANCDGAVVSIDGKKVGTIGKLDDLGVPVTGLHLFLLDGRHEVAINKPGFAGMKRRVFLRGVDYLSVELTHAGGIASGANPTPTN